MNVSHALQQKLQAALTGLVDNPAEYASLVKVAQNPQHGDYQANCAMPLQKVLGKPPRAIAQLIIDRLDLGDLLEKPEIAGPGFINLRLTPTWLAKQIQTLGGDDRLGAPPVDAPRTFVIDYSSPNVAKPLHVGHLRSTIIGDALTRLLRFMGHKVITDNHLGDWGTQFGILFYGYKNFLDRAAYDADPVAELARLYVHVRQQFHSEDEDAEDAADPVQEACRQETALLQAGDPENLALWRQFMPHCLEEINAIYQRLGILKFDHTHGESFYNPMLPGVVEEMLTRGIAQESQCAIVIPNANGVIPDEEAENEEPPGLIRKSDGAFTYYTTDLATIQYRMEHFKPDAILYLVGIPQSLHFKTLFAQARRWGHDKVELTHVTFGSVLDKHGKPFSTSKGGAPLLESLLSEAVVAALQVYEGLIAASRERGEEIVELGEAEKQDVAKVVGLGAVKYADLSQNRTSDYKFIPEKMTALEGDTSAYLQYAYARNRSIFRKGDVEVAALRQNPPPVELNVPHERQLAVLLLRYPEALAAATADYRPNQLTAYLRDLARAYSAFFQHCNVLKAETQALKQSRLLLCDLTARILQHGLSLLGIQTIERM